MDIRRHVLVINNDPAVVAVLRDLLEDEGYRVTTRISPERDLDAIAALAPDLVVIDYMWAEDDGGWSLLQLLRLDRRTAGIPIVLCTGAVREVEALRGRLEELDVRVVLKPFNIDELAATIAEALATVPATAD